MEYENTDSGIEMDFDGLLFIGIRFKSKTIAWDIAGIRPMIDTADSDDSDLMFLPYLKATVFFE